MGRQGYMTRLVLGRSPYEPPEWEERQVQSRTERPAGRNPQDAQLPAYEVAEHIQTYNVRGNPENLASRSAARRARRAQNDVLATIGVCVSVDRNGKMVTTPGDDSTEEGLNAKIIKLIVRENEIGYWMATVEDLLLGAINLFAEGLRSRLLTFHHYAGIPLISILQAELKHFGLFKLVCAGTPAILAFNVLIIISECVLSFFVDSFALWLFSRIKSRPRLQTVRKLLLASEKCLDAVAYMMLAPIHVFGALQQLDLIPATILLPNPRFLSPALSYSLLIPPLSTMRSAGSFLELLMIPAASPLFHLVILNHLSGAIDIKLTQYVRIILPVPSNPDEQSIKASPDGRHMRDNISRTKAQRNGTLALEIYKDIRGLVESFTNLPMTCKRYIVNAAYSLESFRDSFRSADTKVIQADTERPREPDHTTAEQSSPEVERGQSTATPSPVSASFESDYNLEDDAYDEDEDSTENPIRNERVQITTRRGSAEDTHEMNIEWNLSRRNTLDNLSNPSQPMRETAVQYDVSGTHHRVTALSTYPATALSGNIVSILRHIICLPLHSSYVRYVALAYLSAPLVTPAAQSVASRLQGEIYPLKSWFGLGLRGGWKRGGDYTGKLLLVMGIETVLRLGVWEMGVGCAWWFGRRWFRWGKL